jgi:hypothetical protein
MKKLLYTLLALLSSVSVYSQMLFSENLTMKIDSTKTLQGTILPVLDFKNEKENVLTFKNTANFNLLINHNRVINIINKFEFSTYGNKVLVSGGYIHMEYRYLLHHAFEVYPYLESQWAESRGMNHKISTGLQLRYRLVNTHSSLMFAAVGLFFEYEKWQYPAEQAYAYSRSIKNHLSLSFRHQLAEQWAFTTTAIYQTKPDSTFKKPRYGGAIDLKYSITPTVGIRGTYRLIYDTAPIVPVRKDYSTVEVGLDISF